MTDIDESALGQDREPPQGNGIRHGLNGAQNGAEGAGEGAGEGPPASSREATYRIRAREAEAARNALAERVTRMQTAEVERMVTSGKVALHDPDDLWQQVEIVELLDDDSGELDPEKVYEALSALVAQKPHLAKVVQQGPGFGQGTGYAISREPESGASWADVLRGT